MPVVPRHLLILSEPGVSPCPAHRGSASAGGGRLGPRRGLGLHSGEPAPAFMALSRSVLVLHPAPPPSPPPHWDVSSPPSQTRPRSGRTWPHSGGRGVTQFKPRGPTASSALPSCPSGRGEQSRTGLGLGRGRAGRARTESPCPLRQAQLLPASPLLGFPQGPKSGVLCRLGGAHCGASQPPEGSMGSFPPPTSPLLLCQGSGTGPLRPSKVPGRRERGCPCPGPG